MKNLKLIVALVFAAQIGATKAQNLQNGLQACYPLDCDANNYAATGSLLDGTGSNVTCTTGHTGLANTAYAFGNSSTSYISLPNDSRLKPGRISFSGWIKLNAVGASQTIVFAQNSCSIFYEGYSFGVSAAGKLTLVKSGSACWLTSQQVAVATTDLVANTWYHVGFYAGPDVLSIYLNGAPDMTPVANTVFFDYGTTNVFLGGTGTTPNAYFNGAMDDVRFYDRKLSNTEFNMLFIQSPDCSTTGVPTLNDSLQACYPLDCNANNFASTGSSLNGTPVNVTCATGHLNVASTAYQFNNSTSSYISLPSDTRIKSPRVSFSAWVKFVSTAAGQTIVFAQNGCSAYYEGYHFAAGPVSGTGFRLQLVKGSGTCLAGSQQLLAGNSNLSANTWYHVGFYAGPDSVSIYLNGIRDVPTIASTAAMNYGLSTNVYLGGTGTSPNSPLNGYMDDVRFYNRKLWPFEFANLRNLSPSCDASNPGLLNSLQACYPFNCNAINYAPTAGYPPSLNGQLFNVTCTSGHNGDPNTAYQMSGSTSSYIKLPNDPRIKPTNAISVSGWVKINTLNANQYIVFAKNTCSSWFEGYTLGASNVSGAIRFWVAKSSAAPSCGTSGVLNSTNTYNASNWHHVVFCMDNSVIKIYVDGTLDNSLSSSVQLNYDATEGVYLGGTNVSYFNYPLDGKVDNFRFYNRMLVASEVTHLYNYDPSCDRPSGCGGDPTDCREAAPVGIQSLGDNNTGGIEVYPNPNTGKFYIRNTKDVSVKVYDMNGRSVPFTLINLDETTNEVNLLDNANGLYLVKILGADGRPVQTSKVIVTH